MFELSNDQRKCFGLQPVKDNWQRMELKPSPYHNFQSFAYLEGTVIRKLVQTGKEHYMEHEICEQLSDDFKYLQPKTQRGKPVLLSASTLEKRTGQGMCFYFCPGYVSLYNLTSEQVYYSSIYEMLHISDIDGFRLWVEQWCAETTLEDLEDIAQFASRPRIHVAFREGDVFRFKLTRRLYGYGRLVLNYAQMRARKEPMWDILAGQPLDCSVYHIATERADVSVDELRGKKSLPSTHIMDNHLFYGTYEIIGHIPITDHEDYPIMYGQRYGPGEQALNLQCGKLYRKIVGGKELFRGFNYGMIGFDLAFFLPVLQQCIAEDSNAPYWESEDWRVAADLRNPKLKKERKAICKQFGLTPDALIKE